MWITWLQGVLSTQVWVYSAVPEPLRRYEADSFPFDMQPKYGGFGSPWLKRKFTQLSEESLSKGSPRQLPLKGPVWGRTRGEPR